MCGALDTREIYHSSVSTTRPPNPQLLDATALKAARVVDEKGVLDELIPGRIRIDLFLLSARFMGEVIPRTL